MIESFALRVSVRCKQCKQLARTMRLSTHVRCACGNTIQLPQNVWTNVFDADAFAEALADNESVGTQSVQYTHKRELHVVLGRKRPRCQRCKHDLDMRGLADLAASGAHGSCPGCKTKISVRAADDLARALVPTAKMVVHEALADAPYKAQEDDLMFLVVDLDEATRRKIRWADTDNQIKDARSGKLKPEVAAELARAEDEDVREALVKNPVTPVEVLATLVADPSEDVRTALARNKALTPSLQEALAKDADEDVREVLAANPAITPEVLARLANDAANDVQLAVCASPNVTPALLERLALNHYYKVRVAVVANAQTPAETLALLASDDDNDVVNAFIQRKDLPVEAVEALARSHRVDARTVAAKHPALSIPTLRKLANDEDSRVRDPAKHRMAELRAQGVEVDPPVEEEVTIAGTVRGRDDAEVRGDFTLGIVDADDVLIEVGEARVMDGIDGREGAKLFHGTRVIVHGFIRTAPNNVRKLRAQRIATAVDESLTEAIVRVAPPAPEPRPELPSLPAPLTKAWKVFAVLALIPGLLGLVVWGDLAATLAHGHVPTGLVLIETGIMLGLVACALWLVRAPFDTSVAARWRAIDKAKGLRPPYEVDDLLAGIFIPGILVIASGNFIAVASQSISAAAFAPFALGGVGLIIALVIARRHRDARALAARLGASRNTIEGTVDASELVLAQTVTYVRRSSSRTENYTKQDGSTGTRTVTTSWLEGTATSLPLSTFRVRTADGVVQVLGARPLWGAPMVYRRPQEGHSETYAEIAAGDSVVVSGRVETVEGIPTIRVDGPESVAMFGARSAARATLRALIGRWESRLYILLALCVAALAWGIVIATTPT
ncbi:MAG: hypothetical protein SFX73_07970 [Kofleriaceae bacterium]|nr:hypothetical protein [Kofleriaceae bacterium]